MSAARKWPEDREADAEKTREQLLVAATRLFGQRGYADTSISDICAELNITKGALFHHFKSKDALFREVWTRVQMDMDHDAATPPLPRAARAILMPPSWLGPGPI